MRCCDCEFRSACDESEIVLTAFCSCEKRNRLLAEKMAQKRTGAEEMFRELGYHRHDGQATHLWGSRNSLFYYEKKEGGKTVSITYNTVGYERPCVKVYVDEIETNTLFTDEILAIARMIEEMEAENGKAD